MVSSLTAMMRSPIPASLFIIFDTRLSNIIENNILETEVKNAIRIPPKKTGIPHQYYLDQPKRATNMPKKVPKAPSLVSAPESLEFFKYPFPNIYS